MDFRKSSQTTHTPLTIGNEAVERAQIRVLGRPIPEYYHNLSYRMKAQQHLFYLGKLKRAQIPPQLMVNCYHCAASRILAYGFLVWFSTFTLRQ